MRTLRERCNERMRAAVPGRAICRKTARRRIAKTKARRRMARSSRRANR